MTRSTLFLRLGAAAATGVLLLGAGEIAIAAIPDGNTFTGCYDVKFKTGNLRIIDSSKHCLAGETRITWNQAGQPGASGAPGEKGDKGDPGQDATITDGSIDGENDNILRASPQGALALGTVGRGNLAPQAVDSGQMADGAVGAAQLSIARVSTEQLSNAIAVAPESFVVFTFQISNMQAGDLVNVINPAVGGLIMQATSQAGSISIQLYNASTTTKVVPAASTWTIRWIDITP